VNGSHPSQQLRVHLRLRSAALLATTALSVLHLLAPWAVIPEARADLLAPGSAKAGLVERRAAPMLWRVEAPAPGPTETRGSLTLLGSIHVGPPEGWIFAPSVEQAFVAAEVLVVEVDLEDRSAAERDDATLQFGLLATHESLGERISPELYQQTRARLEELGQPIMGIDRLEPWMVAVTLSAMEIERAGHSSENGVDLQLMNRARGEKEIIALESAREQLALLDGLSPELQSLMLEEVLLNAADLGSYFEELMQAWRRGDQSALEKLVFRELDAHPELAPFYEAVIFRRNESMAKRLAELLGSGRRLFVVIGAAHLAGERGIPAQLRALGLRVDTVPATREH
jgi:uncharacterized protein YbaP (TraB family)